MLSYEKVSCSLSSSSKNLKVPNNNERWKLKLQFTMKSSISMNVSLFFSVIQCLYLQSIHANTENSHKIVNGLKFWRFEGHYQTLLARVCPAMQQPPSRVPWTSPRDTLILKTLYGSKGLDWDNMFKKEVALVPISPWKQWFLWGLILV